MSNKNSSVGVIEAAWTAEDLPVAMLNVCQRLLSLLNDEDEIAADLDAKFRRALHDIVDIKISPLEKNLGAFAVSDGVLFLNEPDIARLIHFVLDDLSTELSSGNGNIDSDCIKATLHDTVSLFMLHELRHRTQGVGSFETVQLLKEIEGRAQQAKFDTHADRDAALALAVANADGAGSSEFLMHYERALFYSMRFFFKIYPASADRLDKSNRVAALLLMLARLYIYRQVGTLRSGEPTDAIRVTISGDKKKIAVYRSEPSDTLLSASNDIEDLPDFIRNIENGQLQTALGQAINLAIDLDLN